MSSARPARRENRVVSGCGIFLLSLGLGVPAWAQAAGGDVSTHETWLAGAPRGVAVVADGLAPERDCFLQLIRDDGTVCHSATVDALGRMLATDAGGRLVTRVPGLPGETPLAWACLDSGCIGSAAASCHTDESALSRVVLACEGSQALELHGPVDVDDPSGAGLSVEPGAAGTDFSFLVIPTLHSDARMPEALCAVAVHAAAGELPAAIASRARAAIEQDDGCAGAGVAPDPDSTGADGTVRLSGPGLTGTQLVPGVHVAPGQATGRCFSMAEIGDPGAGQSLRMALRWSTVAGGAAGGEISIVERTPLGDCPVSVSTDSGQSAASLAQSIAQALVAPAGPAGACGSASSARDAIAIDDRLVTTVASSVEVCVDDENVGFTLGPDGVGNLPPVARCEDVVADCVDDGEGLVTLDASDSLDPDGLPGEGLTYGWYRNFGQADQQLLGQGPTLQDSFPLGQDTVTLVVTDPGGLEGQAECAVHVVDTTPPEILTTSLSAATLSPPNHRMVDVHANVLAEDACTETTLTLVSVESSEPDDAPGPEDGSTVFDVQDAAIGTADVDFHLRAERDSRGDGRSYRITYEIRDAHWNRTTWETDVFVPNDGSMAADPIEVAVDRIEVVGAEPVTRVTWTDEADAGAYDVERGSLRNVMRSGNHTHLGTVDCLQVGGGERRVEETTTVARGDVAFYLVQAVEGGGAAPARELGFGTASAAVPRLVESCRPLATGWIRDPERDNTSPTRWGWLTSVSEASLNNHLGQYSERLVDIDRIGPNQHQIVSVRNAGETYGTPAFWWRDQDEAGVIAAIQSVNGRILDIEPFVVGGQTRLTVSIIPNEGKRGKAWWWNYDQTEQQIVDAINLYNMRLIDLEPYQKNGQTLYAYVGIHNVGVDASPWWFWFDLTFDSIGEVIDGLGGRLIDIEVRGENSFSVIMIQNDGTSWWWGAGLTADRVGTFVDGKASRLVDLERFQVGNESRYAFISIDNVNTAEGRRLRPILDGLFEGSQFGPNTTRGLLVKEVNGPVIAEIASSQPFQPASTLKLLPYLYAVQEVDRGNKSLDGSTVSWLGDPNDSLAACLTSGVSGSATLRDALPTMMWYSHNRTLDAFFDLYPPYSSNSSVETLTSRAQTEWGMPDTRMYLGCPGTWLNNRSTLHDIATLYEGVHDLSFFNSAGSRDIFWNNMINQMQGDCRTSMPGSGTCTCPSYAPGCTGNYYISPYVGDTSNDMDTDPDFVGPVGIGFLQSLVQAEGGSGFPVNAFMDEILMRGKGGGGAVPNYPVAGFWDSYASNSLHVTLPFKNGNGDVVPRSFSIAWFINNWDWTCGTGSENDPCKAIIATENGQAGTLFLEMLRIPIRMAVATW